MPAKSLSVSRNQSMECFKLIAAVLVVFIHVKFPGDAGSLMTAVARVAVPMFFAISGYFSYQVKGSRLVKRMGNVLKLYAVTVLITIAAQTVITLYGNGSIRELLLRFLPDMKKIATLLLLNESCFPDTGFCWYLISVALCYLILYVYSGFFGGEPVRYRGLYTVSAFALMAHLLMGEMAIAAEASVPFRLYRNGLFLGLPMFGLGLFLREYRERIFANYRLTDGKLAAVILLGIALTLLQWKGVGTGELPPGAVVQTAGLILLLSAHPDLKLSSKAMNGIISSLGTVSTVVYLVHYPLIGIYETFLLPLNPLTAGKEAWLRPVLVAAMSIAAGFLFVWLQTAAKGVCRRIRGR